MDNFKILKEKIKNNKANVCIIGLGYVGLPLAISFCRNFFVFGFDINKERIEKLKKGISYILDVDGNEVLELIKKNKFLPTTDESVLNKVDAIIICVPTPLRKIKIPDISYIIEATKKIKKYLKPPKLIVLESTSYPTTTKDVVLPILKETSLEEEKDFFLAFSPERVNPGDKNFPITKIPKIVGGLSEKSTELTELLYKKIIKKVYRVSSPEVAETAKLLENTFRLINIALVNEFAILCNKLNIDIWEVIEASKTKPFGFMPFYPGPGIGGHCIPTDPIYLSWKAKKIGFKTKMIDLAYSLNRYMPKYVVERLKELLGNLKDKNILILGVAYKKDVKDLRESPALDVIENLKKENVSLDYYDPYFPYLDINNINLKCIKLNKNNLKKYDCVVIITDHFIVDYKFIQKNSKLIFDTRNVYKKYYKNVVKL